MTTNSHESGFTFVEMLVVLAIIAATLAISFPFAKSYSNARRLEASAQIIALRLQQIQALAISSNAEQLFKVDLKHAQILDPIYTLSDGTKLQLETTEGQVSADLATIRFFADGGSTGGKLTLLKDKDRWDIAINWLDGAVVIRKVAAQ